MIKLVLLAVLALPFLFMLLRKRKTKNLMKRSCRVPYQSPSINVATTEVVCPFIVFNRLTLHKTLNLRKGSEITKNFYVIAGEIGVFFKNKQIGTIKAKSITFSPFEMFKIPSIVKKYALTDVTAVEMPDIEPNIVTFKYFEKLIIEPLLLLDKQGHELFSLETLTASSFEHFLEENFNIENYKVDQTEVRGSFDIKEAIYYVVSGEITISNVKFTKNSIFGYFGLFFSRCRGDYTASAALGTVIKCISYNAIKCPNISIETLKKFPEHLILLGEGASWHQAHQGTMIQSKELEVKNLLIIDGHIHASKELFSNRKLEADLVAKKKVDIVKIPLEIVNILVRALPTAFERLTQIMFDSSNILPKVFLITPSIDNCDSFFKRLSKTLLPNAIILKNKGISTILGKDIFAPYNELIITDFLKKQIEKNKIVILYLDNEFSSLIQLIYPICDKVFIVGDKIVPTKFQGSNIEFIKLCEYRGLNESSKNKIQNFVMKNLLNRFTFRGEVKNIFEKKSPSSEDVINNNLHKKSYQRVHHIFSPKEHNFCNKDYERFARYLLGESYGLTLSGGGARGYAHIGVIKALEEENIPIDIIGGTSMGAFVGGLYSRKLNYLDVYTIAKKSSKIASSMFLTLLDCCYPFLSLFSGRSLDNFMVKTFKQQQIEDFWIEYYCVSTDILSYDQKVFFEGPAATCIRSSMTVAGLLPPVFYKDEILVDGAYVNNTPLDIMKDLNVKNIVVCKVDSELVENFENDDCRSGIILLLKSLLSSKSYLTMIDTLYRLSFLSSEKRFRTVSEGCLLITPDLEEYKPSDFHKFDEIIACGYEAGKKMIKQWKAEGKLKELKKGNRRYTL